MHPQIAGWYSYYLMWAVGTVLMLTAGISMALKDGDVARRLVVGTAVFAVIIFGSKLLYIIEQQIYPADDIIPTALRSDAHGFRIPGGILAGSLVLPLACRLLGFEWRAYADRFVLLLPALLICIRLGCFLNGCCFGDVWDFFLAVAFPPGSVAYYFHLSNGLIPPGAAHSLPVHPLQLYFAAAAAVIWVTLVIQRRYLPMQPGATATVFLTLFFCSTLILESFRGSRLQLNEQLITAIVAALLFTLSIYSLKSRAAT